MKYVVKETCYWGNRYYRKGETVELGEAVKPPEHFASMDPPKAEEPKPAVKAATKKGKANG